MSQGCSNVYIIRRPLHTDLKLDTEGSIFSTCNLYRSDPYCRLSQLQQEAWPFKLPYREV